MSYKTKSSGIWSHVYGPCFSRKQVDAVCGDPLCCNLQQSTHTPLLSPCLSSYALYSLQKNSVLHSSLLLLRHPANKNKWMLTSFQMRFIVFVQVKKKPFDIFIYLSADHLHKVRNTGVLNYLVQLIYFLMLNKYMSK